MPSRPWKGESGWNDRHWMRGFKLLQPPRRADERAAGAEPRHVVRHAAFRLLENLGSGGQIMGAPVGGVIVLVRVEIKLGIFLGQAAHPANGAVGAFHGVGVDNLRAVGFQNALALHAHVGGHAKLHAVVLGGADHRVGNAGVAGGRVDQDFVPRHQPGGFRLADNVHRRAVLHRAAGILPFRLGVNLDIRRCGANSRQAYQ